MEKTTHNKKEIKAIKKDLQENGFNNYYFSYDIKNVITMDDIIEVIREMQLNGVNISNFSNFEMENYIIFEILRLSNYQDFKNRFFEYIF